MEGEGQKVKLNAKISTKISNTVKLGYNERGYYKNSVITNEEFGPKSQFSQFITEFHCILI